MGAGGVDLIGQHRRGHGAELGAEGVHRGRAAREVEGVADDGRAVIAVGGRGRSRGVEHPVRGDGLEAVPRVGSGVEQPETAAGAAVGRLVDDGVVARRKSGRDRGGAVDEGAAEAVAGDGHAVDEERHAVVGSRTEGVVTALPGGNIEEAGEDRGAVRERTGRAGRTIGEDAIVQQVGDHAGSGETDTGHLLGHHRSRGGGQAGESTIKTAADIAEAGHLRPGQHRVLHAQRIRTGESHGRPAVQVGGRTDGDQVREHQFALADVDGLEARRIAEDNDASARVDVDLRCAGPG